MIEKKLQIHELKYYHGNDFGFVFSSEYPSSDDSLKRLADTLLRIGVSKKLPEFFVRVTSNDIAFVYSNDSEFLSGPFYRATRPFTRMGVFDIDVLSGWLENH